MSAILAARRATQTIRTGFYLVAEGKRHWISTGYNGGALEQLLNRLYPREQPDWWIDYCFGPDINGDAAWANLDYTDRFVP